MDWTTEIIELHEFFEAYFLGTVDSIERLESALESDFTMIGPTGVLSNRGDVARAVGDGHAHTDTLAIEISDIELLAERNGVVVARYVETHHLAERSNHRMTTAVFVERPNAPNGVGWLHAHETWLDRGVD